MKKFKSKIIEGDVIKVLKKLDRDNKFDVIIADLPYNIGKNFGNNIDYRELQNYIKWSKNWIEQCLELLSDNGLIFTQNYKGVKIFLRPSMSWQIWYEIPLSILTNSTREIILK